MKTSRRHHPLASMLTDVGCARLKGAHPWLYRTHLREGAFPFDSAGIVRLGAQDYLYSPHSEIRLRKWGPFTAQNSSTTDTVPERLELLQDRIAFEKAYGSALQSHLKTVWDRKKASVEGDRCFRWIFAESDGIPGLVIDMFDATAVAQIQSAPVEKFWPSLKPILTSVLSEKLGQVPQWAELRNMPVRKKEGLPVEAITASPDEGRWVSWNGFEWWMNPGGPQKTGAYLDQRENHLAAAQWARRLKCQSAWDLCCFEGGFTLHLAKAGLKVEALDQSATALRTMAKNLERNGLAGAGVQSLEANVFDELRARHQRKESTDFIVLDPPSFVRSRTDKDGALRGLKELNLRALHCLKPGGILVTCTCSHHILNEDLQEVVAEAALDSRRRLKLVESRGPSPDHAPLVGFPESNYLQALYFEVL